MISFWKVYAYTTDIANPLDGNTNDNLRSHMLKGLSGNQLKFLGALVGRAFSASFLSFYLNLSYWEKEISLKLLHFVV